MFSPFLFIGAVAGGKIDGRRWLKEGIDGEAKGGFGDGKT